MDIKINGKKHKIKTAANLTVREYMQFYNTYYEGMSEMRALTSYISIVTDIELDDVMNVRMDEKTILRLRSYIGTINSIDEFANINSKAFIYNNTGKFYRRGSLKWRTVGVRTMLQERKTDNELELLVYLLAVLIGGCTDADKAEEVYNHLLEHSALDVFSFVCFFFVNLKNGSRLEMIFTKLMSKLPGINTLTSLRRSQEKD